MSNYWIVHDPVMHTLNGGIDDLVNADINGRTDDLVIDDLMA